MLTAVYETVYSFENEWLVFLKEYGDWNYGILPYFISKSIIEIPFSLINPLIFSCMSYFAIGFDYDFFWFLFFSFAIFMIVVCSASYGMMISIAFKHVALDFTHMFMMPLVLFGGFFANS